MQELIKKERHKRLKEEFHIYIGISTPASGMKSTLEDETHFWLKAMDKELENQKQSMLDSLPEEKMLKILKFGHHAENLDIAEQLGYNKCLSDIKEKWQ